MLTGAVYQPLAPLGAAGLSAPLTVGGVLSSESTAASAMTKPAPQSVAGAAVAQATVLAGLVITALTWSTVRLGAADRISVAMPAALGVAALVPPNGLKPGTEVETASAASSAGFGRT